METSPVPANHPSHPSANHTAMPSTPATGVAAPLVSTPPAPRSPAATSGAQLPAVGLAVSNKERQLFFRRFATLVKAGISVASALQHLSQEGTNKALREAAHKAQICAAGGGRLSAWMRTRPTLFTPADCVMVFAGETSGNIDQMLDRIATELEEEVALHQRLSLATFISKFVILPLLLLVPGLPNVMLYGLDALEKTGRGTLLSQQEQQRVILTEGLRVYSHELFGRLLVFALLVVTVSVVWRLLPLFERGKRFRAQWAVSLPGFGRLWRDRALSRYLSVVGMLTAAGLTTPAALEACVGLAGNEILDEKFEAAASLARCENVSLTQAVASTRLLSAPVQSLIATGEVSGAAPSMLNQAADIYASDVQHRMISTPKIVGIIVFLLSAIVVGTVLAMFVSLLYNNMFIGVDKFMEMK